MPGPRHSASDDSSKILFNITQEEIPIMKKKLNTVEFSGTKEQEQKLISIIADYKDV